MISDMISKRSEARHSKSQDKKLPERRHKIKSPQVMKWLRNERLTEGNWMSTCKREKLNCYFISNHIQK